MSVDNSYHVNAKKTNLKEGDHRKDYRVIKTCQGDFQCMNSFCTLYKVDTRLTTKKELIKTRKRLICKELVAWTKRKVKAVLYFSVKRMDCTVTHIINKSKRIFHDHGSYSQKHLTQDQLEKVDELVNSGLTGIAGGKISDILINKDRVKHELRASRIRNGLYIRTNDLFEEFTKIEDECPDYINSAELVSSRFCSTFSAPMMTMNKPPFETHPMITDVTYKAVCDGYYLCSTIRPVFVALFAIFAIKPESFLGMIMDFSMAQREGFLQAFLISFGFSKAQAMPFLKGCYMHWKQSVQRIVSNHAVVSPEKAQRFLNLTYNMQRTTIDVVFDETVQSILREFPNSRRWVQWWLQPSISSFVVDDPVEILGNGTCDDITAFQNKNQGSDERKIIEEKTDVDHEDNDDYSAIQRSLGFNLDNEDDKNDRKKLVKRVEKKEDDKKEDEDKDYEFDADCGIYLFFARDYFS
ncbi:hypothetical protein BD770DRAFT_376864 [Pilaira anomala]|nr:hypothetical protein BD770DRAFT_376864 [Pilaira anomala]